MEKQNAKAVLCHQWITGIQDWDAVAVPGWWPDSQTPAWGSLIALPHQCHPLLKPSLHESIEIKNVSPSENQMNSFDWNALTKEEERENDPDSVVPSSIRTQARRDAYECATEDWIDPGFLKESLEEMMWEFGGHADWKSLRAKGKVVPFCRGPVIRGQEQ